MSFFKRIESEEAFVMAAMRFANAIARIADTYKAGLTPEQLKRWKKVDESHETRHTDDKEDCGIAMVFTKADLGGC